MQRGREIQVHRSASPAASPKEVYFILCVFMSGNSTDWSFISETQPKVLFLDVTGLQEVERLFTEVKDLHFAREYDRD